MTFRLANLALAVALMLTAAACTDPREERRTTERATLTSQLQGAGATYAQAADWGVAEAEGFIKLYGMSSTLWAEINREQG